MSLPPPPPHPLPHNPLFLSPCTTGGGGVLGVRGSALVSPACRSHLGGYGREGFLFGCFTAAQCAQWYVGGIVDTTVLPRVGGSVPCPRKRGRVDSRRIIVSVEVAVTHPGDKVVENTFLFFTRDLTLYYRVLSYHTNLTCRVSCAIEAEPRRRPGPWRTHLTSAPLHDRRACSMKSQRTRLAWYACSRSRPRAPAPVDIASAHPPLPPRQEQRSLPCIRPQPTRLSDAIRRRRRRRRPKTSSFPSFTPHSTSAASFSRRTPPAAAPQVATAPRQTSAVVARERRPVLPEMCAPRRSRLQVRRAPGCSP